MYWERHIGACGYYLFGLTRLGGRCVAGPCSYCMSGQGGGVILGGEGMIYLGGYYVLGFQDLLDIVVGYYIWGSKTCWRVGIIGLRLVGYYMLGFQDIAGA